MLLQRYLPVHNDAAQNEHKVEISQGARWRQLSDFWHDDGGRRGFDRFIAFMAMIGIVRVIM